MGELFKKTVKNDIERLSFSPALSTKVRVTYEIEDGKFLHKKVWPQGGVQQTIDIQEIQSVEKGKWNAKSLAGIRTLIVKTSTTNMELESIANPDKIRSYILQLKTKSNQLENHINHKREEETEIRLKHQENFDKLTSFPAGFLDLSNTNSETVRIENVCFVGKEKEYIATTAYNKNLVRIWEISSGELVQTLESKAGLKLAIRDYGWVITIESDNVIVAWGEEKSIESKFGVEWKQVVREKLPEIEGISQPTITQILLFDSQYVGALVHDKDGSKSAICRCYLLRSKERKGIEVMDVYDTEIGYIKPFGRQRIAAIKASEYCPKVFVGEHEYNLSDAEVLFNGHEVIGVSHELGGIRYMGDRIYDWSIEDGYHPKGTYVEPGTSFNSIRFNKVTHYEHRILVAVASIDGTIYVVRPHGNHSYGVLKGHTRLVTKLIWETDYLISASEDRTIRVWDVFKRKEIGRFENCHPIMHPFDFSQKNQNFEYADLLAYADVDGYVHVYKCNYKL